MTAPGPSDAPAVRVRFAPSPTGFLHVGGARTALYNHLHARATGGTFVLRGEDPRYDGRCRAVPAAERARRRAAGEPAALRFQTPAHRELSWNDVVRGRIAFQSDVLDDFVLVRSDGWPTYNFACVVDDIHM